MALTPKNWAISSYTDDEWTDLVDEPATVATVTICNTSASDVTVQMRLEDNDSSVATILPPQVLAENESQTLDLRSINVTGTQALQVQADTAGAEFLASGVV